MELILENTERSCRFSNGHGKKAIFAKASKDTNRITLYHGINYSNSFLPILDVQLEEKENNSTEARAFWRWGYVTMVYMVIFLTLFLSGGTILAKAQNFEGVIAVVLFAAVFAAFALFCTWLERKNMKKIIEFLRAIENRKPEN